MMTPTPTPTSGATEAPEPAPVATVTLTPAPLPVEYGTPEAQLDIFVVAACFVIAVLAFIAIVRLP